MKMIRVSSDAINAIGYDESTRRMSIEFNQGNTYSYCGVPQHVFDGLLSAASKGVYYNEHIRDKYQC